MKLIGSLNLSETEIETFADRLQDLQIEKMSNFVQKKLDEVEILNLLSKLSDDKVLEALKDLRDAAKVSTNSEPPTEIENRGILELKDIIDQKILSKDL